jgi:hypothetical protein
MKWRERNRLDECRSRENSAGNAVPDAARSKIVVFLGSFVSRCRLLRRGAVLG